MTLPDAIPHDEAAALLPWLVNDSLSEAEASRLRRHAEACLVCRREMRRLETLQEGLRAHTQALPVPEPDMRTINRRIDESIKRKRRFLGLVDAVRWVGANPWPALAAVQSLLIVALLAAVLTTPGGEAEFETLTTETPAHSGRALRVMFAPTVDAPAARSLIESLELGIVAGPSPRNVYTLGCGADACTGAAGKLRAHPDVLFAEPLPPEGD